MYHSRNFRCVRKNIVANKNYFHSMFIVHVMCVSLKDKNGRQELDTKSASIFDQFSMNL